MEVRCSQCGHPGEPAELRAVDAGTEVVCAECGHGALLEASSDGDGSDPPADDVADVDHEEVEEALQTVRSGGGETTAGTSTGRLDWDATYEHLVPDAESGPRCPKCIGRVEADRNHCPQCGLGLSNRDLVDEERWDAIVEQSVQEFVRVEADERWRTTLDEQDSESFEAYVEWMTRHGADDEAIRRVRLFLVQHPEHQPALDALDTLTESVRSRLAAARAKAESESEAFQSDVSRFRRYVVGGLAVFWSLALVLALYLVFG